MAPNARKSALQQFLHDLGGQAEDLGDAQLLAAFHADRDEDAFAELVRRHGPMVLGVCRRVLRDAHAADDVFQATFLVLARKAGSFAVRRSLGNWLYTVAHNLAVNALTCAARRRAHERQVRPVESAKPGSDWRDILDAELSQLPATYRAPLVLCYLQGKTNAQAAQELGWALVFPCK
jgi:RNA polymerase sigma-70 factor (ECF subfamily)